MTLRDKLVLAGLMFGLAVSLATTAIAANRLPVTHLYGPIGDTGRVHETVSIEKKGTGRYRVFRFMFKEIPMTCQNGARTTYEFRERHAAPLATSPSIGYSAAGAVVTLSTDGGAQPQYSWELEVEAHGARAASGTLRVRGSDLEVDGSSPQKCRSGLLDWATTRRD